LALQGDVSEHVSALQRAVQSVGKTIEVVEVRKPGQMEMCQALVYKMDNTRLCRNSL